MSSSPKRGSTAEAYVRAVTRAEGDRVVLNGAELAWLLRHTAEWIAVTLRLLTALQHALPASQAGEIKETADERHHHAHAAQGPRGRPGTAG